MVITKSFTFDAAHFLPMVPPSHKCGYLHGHTYRVELQVAGEPDERTGWIIDFADIAAAWEPCATLLDHRTLNGVAGLENPTAENLVRYVWRDVKPRLSQLSRIVLYESSTTSCIYAG